MPAQRLATNAPGPFFVDSSCIDCDVCRWMAPEVFDRAEEQSRVHHQPAEGAESAAAERALVACPTGSIRTEEKRDLAAARAAFPLAVAEDVFHCGYHAEASFGATSYLIARPPERGGNVLVDSPRWNRGLVARLEALGGVRTLFLTHVDDVADHARFAAHFGCERVMHERDAVAGVERRIAGDEPGTHRGLRLPRLPRPLPLQRGSPRLRREARAFVRLPERDLVRLAHSDRFHGAPCARALRVGAPRPRPARPFPARGDARADAALHRMDAGPRLRLELAGFPRSLSDGA
jgi:ferredoxin